MAGSFTLPTVLANLTAGNQPLSVIDGDLNALANPLLALQTFSNYYQDTGAANAYVITVSAPQTVALAAGLAVQFKAANVNTAASTLAINALGAKNILTQNGAALSAGQIPANGIIDVMYDGTQFLLLSAAGSLRSSFTSTAQTITAAGSLTLAHSLGATPSLIQCRLKNTSAELNYSVNDEIVIDATGPSPTANTGMMILPDATNVNIRFGSNAGASFNVINKTTGVSSPIDNTKWQLIVRAWL